MLSFILKGRGLFQVSDCDNVTPSPRNCLEYTCLNQVGSFIVKLYFAFNENSGDMLCIGCQFDCHFRKNKYSPNCFR